MQNKKPFILYQNSKIMPFNGIISVLRSSPPGRFYLHTAGNTLYCRNAKPALRGAENYLKEILELHKNIFREQDFLLGTIWGDMERKQRVADIFGYRGIKPWPGNPEVSTWVAREYVLTKENPASCEETIALLGEEARLRRNIRGIKGSESLDNFLGYMGLEVSQVKTAKWLFAETVPIVILGVEND